MKSRADLRRPLSIPPRSTLGAVRPPQDLPPPLLASRPTVGSGHSPITRGQAGPSEGEEGLWSKGAARSNQHIPAKARAAPGAPDSEAARARVAGTETVGRLLIWQLSPETQDADLGNPPTPQEIESSCY